MGSLEGRNIQDGNESSTKRACIPSRQKGYLLAIVMNIDVSRFMTGQIGSLTNTCGVKPVNGETNNERCLTSINESASKFFTLSRGLRQKCSISSLLSLVIGKV